MRGGRYVRARACARAAPARLRAAERASPSSPLARAALSGVMGRMAGAYVRPCAVGRRSAAAEVTKERGAAGGRQERLPRRRATALGRCAAQRCAQPRRAPHTCEALLRRAAPRARGARGGQSRAREHAQPRVRPSRYRRSLRFSHRRRCAPQPPQSRSLRARPRPSRRRGWARACAAFSAARS